MPPGPAGILVPTRTRARARPQPWAGPSSFTGFEAVLDGNVEVQTGDLAGSWGNNAITFTVEREAGDET